MEQTTSVDSEPASRSTGARLEGSSMEYLPNPAFCHLVQGESGDSRHSLSSAGLLGLFRRLSIRGSAPARDVVGKGENKADPFISLTD